MHLPRNFERDDELVIVPADGVIADLGAQRRAVVLVEGLAARLPLREELAEDEVHQGPVLTGILPVGDVADTLLVARVAHEESLGLGEDAAGGTTCEALFHTKAQAVTELKLHVNEHSFLPGAEG